MLPGRRNLDTVVAIILGGGRGTRLAPLTNYRSKPAVPLGGKYRLVDITISNCINSGVFQIFILTQFESASLNRHVQRTYQFDGFRGGFVEILAAEQRYTGEKWFQGTADAVRQTIHHTVHPGHQHVLVLAGDALYRMDYGKMLDLHKQTGADVTIAAKTVNADQATGFGVMRVGEGNRVTAFVEKPKHEALGELAMDPATLSANNLDPAKPYLASMGIYLFNREFLAQTLADPLNMDFGKDILPRSIASNKVHVYPHSGYWEDIGTIKAFYDANLSLTDWEPAFSLYDAIAPIYTRSRQLPPPKILDCQVKQAIFGDGSILTAARISRSVMGIRSVVKRGTLIENSYVMGAENYEENDPYEPAPGVPKIPLGIGEDCIIRNAILDLSVRVGNNVKIINQHNQKNFESDLYTIREGIVIVGKGQVLPDNTVI